MKTLTKEQFLEFLVKHGARQSYINWAQSQVEIKDIIEKCPDINYFYWLIKAIGGPLWTKYEEKEAEFWNEYDEKGNALVKELCTFEQIQKEINN